MGEVSWPSCVGKREKTGQTQQGAPTSLFPEVISTLLASCGSGWDPQHQALRASRWSWQITASLPGLPHHHPGTSSTSRASHRHALSIPPCVPPRTQEDQQTSPGTSWASQRDASSIPPRTQEHHPNTIPAIPHAWASSTWTPPPPATSRPTDGLRVVGSHLSSTLSYYFFFSFCGTNQQRNREGNGGRERGDKIKALSAEGEMAPIAGRLAGLDKGTQARWLCCARGLDLWMGLGREGVSPLTSLSAAAGPSVGTFGSRSFGEEEKHSKATGALQSRRLHAEARPAEDGAEGATSTCSKGTGLPPFPRSAGVWDGRCTQIL